MGRRLMKQTQPKYSRVKGAGISAWWSVLFQNFPGGRPAPGPFPAQNLGWGSRDSPAGPPLPPAPILLSSASLSPAPAGPRHCWIPTPVHPRVSHSRMMPLKPLPTQPSTAGPDASSGEQKHGGGGRCQCWHLFTFPAVTNFLRVTVRAVGGS